MFLSAKSDEHTDENIQRFLQLQQLPYEAKVSHAAKMAKDFYNTITSPVGEYYANCHVSVGGLDSITLLLFLRSIGIDVPAISVSSIEDRSIQRIHKQLGVIQLKTSRDKDGKPYSKHRILQEYGFPVISKEKRRKSSICRTRPKIMLLSDTLSLRAKRENTAGGRRTAE